MAPPMADDGRRCRIAFRRELDELVVNDVISGRAREAAQARRLYQQILGEIR